MADGDRLPLDETDRTILTTLQESGRTPWARLADAVGMTAPSVTDRVRRLEEGAVIRGFEARLDPSALGLSTLGFVLVGIAHTMDDDVLRERVSGIPAVQECHAIAGEYDYLLKIRCESPGALADLVRDGIRSLSGVVRTNTLVVLHSVKESAHLPLPRE